MDGGNSNGIAELYVANFPVVTPPDGGKALSSPTVFIDVGLSGRRRDYTFSTGRRRSQWRAPAATGWMNEVRVGVDTVFVSTGEYLVALDRVTGAVLYGVKQCLRGAWSRWSTVL